MANHNAFLQMAQKRTEERFRNIPPEVRASFPLFLHSGEWWSWGPFGVIGVFYQTEDGRRVSEQFEQQGLGPYPGLLTTDPTVPVAINISAPLGFFASNRIEGQAFRVQPTASFTLWQHAQVFRERSGRRFVYSVPLAFLLGVGSSETEFELQERLDQLIDHTLQVWRELDVRA